MLRSICESEGECEYLTNKFVKQKLHLNMLKMGRKILNENQIIKKALLHNAFKTSRMAKRAVTYLGPCFCL